MEKLRQRDSLVVKDAESQQRKTTPSAKPAPTIRAAQEEPSLSAGVPRDEASEGEKIQLDEVDPPDEETDEAGVKTDNIDHRMSAWTETVCWLFAKYGNLEMNLLHSETRHVMRIGDTDEAEQLPRTLDPGVSVWKIVGVTFGLRLGALMLAALVGVAMGLTISSLAQSNTQAVMWVPLILIPQILFGGYVVTAPEMLPSVRFFSTLMPSHAAQQMSDVSHIYGQRIPKMTNQTKIPAFLSKQADLGIDEPAPSTFSKGGDEVVKWTIGNKTVEQKFDKTSPHNVAWQNLIVVTESVGQHRKIESGGKIVNSVNKRGDVIYPYLSLYTDTSPALEAGFVLGGWFVGCYLLISFTLKKRQYGK
jgi:hypothetical protein